MSGQDWSGTFRGLANKPYDLLVQIERALGATAESASEQQRTWSGLGLDIGGTHVVVPRDDVSEVIAAPRLTRVPGSAAWLLGVANVRGSLLPIIDAAAFYGLAAADEQASGSAKLANANIVVVNSETVQAGLRVTVVHGYREFQVSEQRSELIGESPQVLQPDLLGAFVQGGERWLALSLRHLVLSERFAAASAANVTGAERTALPAASPMTDAAA